MTAYQCLYVTGFAKNLLPTKPLYDNCKHYLTVQAGIGAGGCLGCLAVDCIWGLLAVHKSSGDLQTANVWGSNKYLIIQGISE